jgi:hypothetical protein
MTSRVRSLAIRLALSQAAFASTLSAQCESWTPDFSRPDTNSAIHALRTFDDGSGPALYAAGNFRIASDVPCEHIARWNGTRWSPVGGGIPTRGSATSVVALATFDDGQGPALYAAGSFESAGGIAAHAIARWNGAHWSAFATEFPYASIRALTVFDDGTGSTLIATGGFPGGTSVVRWTGATWSRMGTATGLLHDIATMASFDDGSGPALFVSGAFDAVDGVLAHNVARWRGGAWEAVGIVGNESIDELAIFDDGQGPRLYGAGAFLDANNVFHVLGRWNGSTWTALGPASTAGTLSSLCTFDPGAGTELFGFLHSTPLGGDLLRWNGAQYALLGSSIVGVATAMSAFDDGHGSKLFTAGTVASADNALVANIASWDGGAWSALGSAQGSVGVDDG